MNILILLIMLFLFCDANVYFLSGFAHVAYCKFIACKFELKFNGDPNANANQNTDFKMVQLYSE